jgi:hypothetical protein
VVAVLAVVTYARHASRSGNPPDERQHAVEMDPNPVNRNPVAPRATLPVPQPALTMEQARQFGKKRAEQFQEIAAANADFRKAMAARYQGEKTNPAWAAETERRISSVLAELQSADSPKPGDLSVDCKATVCRINATFAGQAQADTWVSMLMPSLGGVLNKAVVSRVESPAGIALDIYGTEN